MSKIDYQALRAKAEKATCGEWSLEYGEGRFDGDDALIHREAAGYIPICRIEGAHPESGFDEDFQMEQQANAEFIAAANPATVLALLGELETAKKRIAELEAEPVSQAYNLPELIEGMEVSIDVSTCDADLGNRYFGTVTEASELDTAKNGYILLVQDAEPNFDVNGNSPVTPDSWISRFEEMPDPSSERRVCAFTPTNHEDMRYRFVPASLFKTVCRDATHWFYMLPPVGREEVAGG
ncbi:ead/Ea22-like family protein [Escherichia coli]|uniref:ead/Ea22-like family protein n=1 Tax=Escherichia coli TaxID=562 RepID=UPI0021E94A5C|nr:ead/Ea22-like family protein [Escherichia coli]MCV2988985.1 ead/Ea22-like family protein [Escherichia coli]MCV3071076.1 ead/Ea22-like family protein [Escherichia coli]